MSVQVGTSYVDPDDIPTERDIPPSTGATLDPASAWGRALDRALAKAASHPRPVSHRETSQRKG